MNVHNAIALICVWFRTHPYVYGLIATLRKSTTDIISGMQREMDTPSPPSAAHALLVHVCKTYTGHIGSSARHCCPAVERRLSKRVAERQLNEWVLNALIASVVGVPRAFSHLRTVCVCLCTCMCVLVYYE